VEVVRVRFAKRGKRMDPHHGCSLVRWGTVRALRGGINHQPARRQRRDHEHGRSAS
jgi:hypothetical protein